MGIFIFFAVLLAGAVILVVGVQRSRSRARQHILGYVFDASVGRRLAEKFPDLGSAQQAQVLEGLRDFLLICQSAGRRPVSMPSKAVDEAWHGFILSTRAYRDFCKKAFGRYLHHHPAETMSSPTQAGEGIRRAWKLACERESINPTQPGRLPRLFGMDAQLAIAGGFIYSLNCQAAGAAAAGSASSFCATHIGCSSGCSTGCSTGSTSSSSSNDSSSDSGSSGSSCSGGCGGGGD